MPVSSRRWWPAFFGGVGACLTVSNATLGPDARDPRMRSATIHAGRRYALMPSFTFAADGAGRACGTA